MIKIRYQIKGSSKERKTQGIFNTLNKYSRLNVAVIDSLPRNQLGLFRQLSRDRSIKLNVIFALQLKCYTPEKMIKSI